MTESEQNEPHLKTAPDEAVALDRAPLAGLIVVGLMAIAAVTVGAALMAFFLAFDCGGDGGSPYVAEASLRGRLCDGSTNTNWAAATLIVPPFVASGAVVRSVIVARWRPMLLGVGCAAVFAIGSAITWFSLSGSCSNEQRAAATSNECERY